MRDGLLDEITDVILFFAAVALILLYTKRLASVYEQMITAVMI